MKQSTSITRRFIAFVLAVAMTVTMVPTSAFAAYTGPGATNPVTEASELLRSIVTSLDLNISAVSVADQASKGTRETYVKNKIQAAINAEKALISGVASALDDLAGVADSMVDAIEDAAEAVANLEVKQGNLRSFLDIETKVSALTVAQVKIGAAPGKNVTVGNIAVKAKVDPFTKTVITSLNADTSVSVLQGNAAALLTELNQKINKLQVYQSQLTPGLAKQATYLSAMQEITALVTNINDLLKNLDAALKGVKVTYSNAVDVAMAKLNLAITNYGANNVSLTPLDLKGLASLTTVTKQDTVMEIIRFADNTTGTTIGMGKDRYRIVTAKTKFNNYFDAFSNATIAVNYLGGTQYSVTITVKLNGYTNVVSTDIIKVQDKALNTAEERLKAVQDAIEEAQPYRLTVLYVTKTQTEKNNAVKALVSAERPSQYTGEDGVTVTQVVHIGGSYHVYLKDLKFPGEQYPQFPVVVNEDAASPAAQVAAFRAAIELLATARTDTGITMPIEKQGSDNDRIQHLTDNIALVKPDNNTTALESVDYMNDEIYRILLKNGSAVDQFTIIVKDVTYSDQEKLLFARDAVLRGEYEISFANSSQAKTLIKSQANTLVKATPGCASVIIDTFEELNKQYYVVLRSGAMRSQEFAIPTSQVKIWTAQEEFDIAKAAIQDETYKMPADKDTQALKTAWVKAEVEAVLADFDTFTCQISIIYADGEDRYYAELTVNGIKQTLLLNVIPDPGTDLTAYKAAIALAEAAVTGKDLYTTESFDAFNAIWVLCNTTLTVTSKESDVVAATAMINVALNQLVLKNPVVVELTLTPETTQGEFVKLTVNVPTGLTPTEYHWHRVNWSDQTGIGEYTFIGTTSVPELTVTAPGHGGWGYQVAISDNEGKLVYTPFANLICSTVGTPAASQDGSTITLNLAGDASGDTYYYWHRVNWADQSGLGAYSFIDGTTVPTITTDIPTSPTGVWGYQAAIAKASDPLTVIGWSYWVNVQAP